MAAAEVYSPTAAAEQQQRQRRKAASQASDRRAAAARQGRGVISTPPTWPSSAPFLNWPLIPFDFIQGFSLHCAEPEGREEAAARRQDVRHINTKLLTGVLQQGLRSHIELQQGYFSREDHIALK
ncbi:unnamed protein product [Urochloa humidicola]